MSASLTVDIGGTCTTPTTIAAGGGGLGTMSGQIGITSGLINAASGGVVGMSCDLLNADTYCNLLVAGQLINTSGQLRIQVQTSDSDVSGNYTDPTSGLPQLPTFFSSGGILVLNSGGLLGGLLGVLQGGVVAGSIQIGAASGVPFSGQCIQSGFTQFAAFQRVGRFVRANVLSGDFYVGPLSVSFVSQTKTTGPGTGQPGAGGFAYAPGSGQISV